MPEPLDEFGLIRRYFAGLTSSAEGVVLGIGDDAALLQIPVGYQLVVTTDTLVAGRHFPLNAGAFDIGWKSLAVNLSDLAAMGAEPRWFTLALTLPELDTVWLPDFSAGLKALADAHAVALVGGDTTRGPLSITLTAMGLVPSAQALRRSGAQPGDLIAVTGTLGDAALALRLLKEETSFPRKRESMQRAEIDSRLRGNDEFLLARLNRPQPRMAAGLALRGLATAVLDLSDGLAGDLSHILRASGVGARIRLDALPRSAAFAQQAPADAVALQTQGGDDYELCICLPSAQLTAARAALDVPLTVIGEVTTGSELQFLDAAGVTVPLAAKGYQHF